MSREYRIPKTPRQNLVDLDKNLFIVRRQIEGLQEDPDPAYFAVLVAALRTLVCMSSGTEGLLWRLIEALEVSDEMQLHAFEGVNPDHPQARGLRLCVLPLLRGGEGPEDMPVGKASLRYLIKECDGVFFAGKGITWEELIKILSQQMGLSHESEELDPVLVQLHQLPILVAAHRQAIVRLAELVLQVGERILEHAEEHCHYVRKARSNRGDLSLFAVVQRLQILTGRMHLFTFKFPVSEVEINCYATPRSVAFEVKKRDHQVEEVTAFYPDEGRAAIFALRYSSNRRKISVLMTDLLDDRAEQRERDCDLGWIESSECRKPLVQPFPMDLVVCHGIFLHKKWLKATEFEDLFQPRGI